MLLAAQKGNWYFMEFFYFWQGIYILCTQLKYMIVFKLLYTLQHKEMIKLNMFNRNYVK
jgi:hypothetical protein